MKRGKKDENLCIFNQCWRLFYSFKFCESLECTIRKRLELLEREPRKRKRYHERYYLHLLIVWNEIRFYFHSLKMLQSWKSWKWNRCFCFTNLFLLRIFLRECFVPGRAGSMFAETLQSITRYLLKLIRQFYDFYKIILAFFKTKLLK